MSASQSLVTELEVNQAKKPRIRKSHHKVRTGCITCKIRRKKCDETKPNCFRCTSTGRKCDGYISNPAPDGESTAQLSLPNRFVYENAADIKQLDGGSQNEHRITKSQRAPWQTIPRYPATQLFVSELDLQCFDYFRLVTAPQLGAYHDSTIWRSFVVRAAFMHPVILKATAALGAVHRRYDLGISPEAFQYCAISNRLFHDATKTYHEFLQHPITDTYMAEVTMIAKMLHGVFHVFQGDYGQATANMTEGLAALWKRPTTKLVSHTARQGSSVDPYIFQSLYRRLAIYAGQILARKPNILVDHRADGARLPLIPHSFASLEQALDLLYTQIDFLCHIPTSIWYETEERQETQAVHVSYLMRWNAALAETTNLMANRTARQIRGFFLLRRIRTTVYLLLYLVLYLRSDTQRRLLDFDMFENDDNNMPAEEQDDTTLSAGDGFVNFNDDDSSYLNMLYNQDDIDQSVTMDWNDAFLHTNPRDNNSRTDRTPESDAQPMINSSELWNRINQDEDILTNLSRITMLVDSTVDQDFSFDRYPYTMSMNIDSGIGPPRSRTPRPESSSKTRHLVRHLLQPAFREKLLADTYTSSETPSLSVSSMSSSSSSSDILSPCNISVSTPVSSVPSLQQDTMSVTQGRLYNIAEQLCSIEEHAVFAAAKQSLIVPRGVQPRWLDVSCFLEEQKMLVRYCCRDEKQGVTGPNGGIVWTQEWVKF